MRVNFKLLLLTICSSLYTGYAADGVDISTITFFDLTYDDSKNIPTSYNLTRSYVDLRRNVADDLKVRITTDAATTSTGPLSVFVKNVLVTWSTSVGDILVGVQPTNYLGSTQANWGNRFMEKFPADLYKFDSTSDLGLSVKRKLSSKLLLHLGVYNGTGFKKPENDSFKRTSLLVTFGEQDLRNRPGWNIGALASVEPYDDGDQVALTQRYSAFGGWASSATIRAGAEFHTLMKDDTGQSIIVSGYGTVKFSPKVKFIARFDQFDPAVDSGGDSNAYLLTGVSFAPQSGFTIAPNIRYTIHEADKDPELSFVLNFEFKM
ncbi:MAG: hypothetical protein QF551_02225 [Candidatus Marinimicrobia bacterium]|nr:hypothetical protein [Candidatus Neomarinimicrobiota bacterium]